jgi:RNA methyltransferase, TrmH family
LSECTIMIGKTKINLIKSLSHKKARQKEQLFLVEGDKNVLEVLQSNLPVKELLATEKFILENKNHVTRAARLTETTADDIKKASLLMHPQNSMALCTLPPDIQIPVKLSGASFYLDGIQDPGNLGTIIRICDWFGMEYLFCSTDTADVFNPKVIQASMGSFCRIKVVYTVFENLAELAKKFNVPVLGTFMDGESIYSIELPSGALIVLGNEGSGIREGVAEKTNTRITIPSLKRNKTGAESLNVAVAAGIIGSEFMRQGVTRPDYSK